MPRYYAVDSGSQEFLREHSRPFVYDAERGLLPPFEEPQELYYQIPDVNYVEPSIKQHLMRWRGDHDWQIKECVPPGAYHPRIARALNRTIGAPHSWRLPEYETLRSSSQGQLSALTQQLQRVLETIHPAPETFSAYGHGIRNLLILACTEVEAQWKGILSANGYQKDRCNTSDYVKIEKAARLREYGVSLSFYPDLPPIFPFESWGVGNSPTQEIPWYDSYNAVKHDREANFALAKLEHALHAVAACAIMLVAQFGSDALDRTDIGSFYRISAVPRWLPSEIYRTVFPGGDADAGPIAFPF